MNSDTIKKLFSHIQGAENILILSSKPDGDSIGASLALQRILSQAHKKVLSYTFFQIPDYLRFIVEKGAIEFEADPDLAKFNTFDLVILVDTNSLKRSTGSVEIPWKAGCTFISLDHHQPGESTETDISILDSSAESTCGMLVDLFRAAENFTIDATSAFFLYCGIVSDTDYFGYGNVNGKTFERASYLYTFDFDKISIIKQFRESLSLKAFKFIQRNITKVAVTEEKRYASLVIRKADYSDEDNLASVNEASNYLNRALLRIIDCVDFSFILREVSDSKTSCALRRHNNGNEVDLSKIAQHFGGGGHKQAAGFVIEKKIDDVMLEMQGFLEKFLE